MNTTPYKCEECGWVGSIEEMDAIDHLHERVFAGELLPAGQCPDCGALIDCDDEDISDNTVKICVSIGRARGLV